MLSSWVDVSRWRWRVSSSRPPDLSLARWKGDGFPPRSPTHRRWHIIVLASAQVTKEGGSPSVSPVHLPMTHGENISRVNRSRWVRVVTTDTELRHFLSHRNCSYFLSLPVLALHKPANSLPNFQKQPPLFYPAFQTTATTTKLYKERQSLGADPSSATLIYGGRLVGWSSTLDYDGKPCQVLLATLEDTAPQTQLAIKVIHIRINAPRIPGVGETTSSPATNGASPGRGWWDCPPHPTKTGICTVDSTKTLRHLKTRWRPTWIII